MPEQPQPVPAVRELETSGVFALILELELEPEGAYTLVREVQAMVSKNLIARLESKLDAYAAAVQGQMAALRTEVMSFRWRLGPTIAFVLLIAIMQILIVWRATGQAPASSGASPGTRSGADAPEATVRAAATRRERDVGAAARPRADDPSAGACHERSGGIRCATWTLQGFGRFRLAE